MYVLKVMEMYVCMYVLKVKCESAERTKLQSEKVCDLYCSQVFTSVIKCMSVRWASIENACGSL
jgi:hypothetical protein